MRLLERAELVDKLKNWQTGTVDAEEIWRWALELKEDYSPGDSVIQDVVDVLAELPQDLVTVEDAQVLIEALETNIGQDPLSQNLIWNYFDYLDTESRKQTLAEDPLYAPFCTPAY
tara:strand:- start:102 stop:449 length:348 start_codon:yes stop_codon:yes gene_type:complete